MMLFLAFTPTTAEHSAPQVKKQENTKEIYETVNLLLRLLSGGADVCCRLNEASYKKNQNRKGGKYGEGGVKVWRGERTLLKDERRTSPSKSLG